MKALFIALVWVGITAWSGTTRDWWFEDDPTLYSVAAAQSSPLPFFYEKSLVRTGAGNEVVPVFFASSWLDSRLAPGNVSFAYWHSALALLIAALLLGRIAGVAVACAWLLLPSTLAVAEFLSTRSYVEGFIFAALAWRSRRWWWFFAALALLSKELFVPSLLTLLGVRFLYEQRWRSLVALLGLAGAYLAYRVWAVGAHVAYSMPLPRAIDVVWLVAWWPQTLSYGAESFVVAGMMVVAAVLVWRDYPSRRHLFWPALLLAVVCLGTLVPITLALINHTHTPATWGRSYFVVNTLLLVAFAWLFRRRVLPWVVLCGVLLLGASRSVDAWDQRKRLNEVEGRFFVEHPGELLVSKNEATWFFEGLAVMYPVHAEVVSTYAPPEQIAAARKVYPRWWWYRDGEMVSVPR